MTRTTHRDCAIDLRLAELAIGLWQRDRAAIEAVQRLVRACGGQWHEQGDGSIAAIGTTGIRVGLLPGGDPVVSAVSLALLFLGEWWPFVVPNLLPVVNKRWRAVAHGGRGSEVAE